MKKNTLRSKNLKEKLREKKKIMKLEGAAKSISEKGKRRISRNIKIAGKKKKRESQEWRGRKTRRKK